MNVNITRRTIVGFGYNTKPTGNATEIAPTERPDYTGTIKQVLEAIDADRTFASMRQGTYYTTAWFVKLNGKWRRVTADDHNTYELGKLSTKSANMFGEMKYDADVVIVEIE